MLIDDDSDDEHDEDLDEDMEPPVEEEISLVDIAKKPSQVHTKIPPQQMLNNVTVPYIDQKGQDRATVLITKTISDDDFEAFVQLLDMYNSLPGKPLPTDLLASITVYDRPAMLDEYIRRTGEGITLAEPELKPEETTASQEAEDDDPDSRVYLGLNVHGKKRKDLAKGDRRNRRQQYEQAEEDPMLWTAAKIGAIGIVRYLASDQPLAAYKYYASTHGDARAKLLRRIPDLSAVLPEKLGWTVSSLNESVAHAAISGGKRDVLEALVSIRGKEIEKTLHLK